MQRLPNWVLNHRFPSVYDSESKSVLEQTARLYGAMQTLIDEYNNFVAVTNNSIECFEKDIQNSNNVFKTEMTCLIEKNIKSIDHTVNDAVHYMKENITDTTREIVNKGIQDGTFGVAVEYNEETESLNIIATGGI